MKTLLPTFRTILLMVLAGGLASGCALGPEPLPAFESSQCVSCHSERAGDHSSEAMQEELECIDCHIPGFGESHPDPDAGTEKGRAERPALVVMESACRSCHEVQAKGRPRIGPALPDITAEDLQDMLEQYHID